MLKTKLLGDVHLGKRFKSGVPLHRRGDREALQWAEFEQHLLDVNGYDVHIQVGDLFDEAIVPFGTIYRAAQAYGRAADANPGVIYVLYQGNHDANRDIEKVTAFRLFSLILKGLAPRVAVLDQPLVLDEADFKAAGTGEERHVFLPWSATLSAVELVEQNRDLIAGADVVYGHWDVDRRQEGGDNYIPAELLAELDVKKIVTGHDHNKRDIEMAGVPVHVTGSMQPYDHSQDADERFYVTRTLAEVLAEPDSFHDKHLRVALARGEVLDVPIDYLQLTIQREGKDEDGIDLDVDFDAFDFDALLAQSIQEVGLGDKVAAEMNSKLAELKLQDDDQNVG